jgi:hypothetical protein
LLTDCVLVGHAQKADIVFTPPQWFIMCAHMMNENPQNFFLMPYRDDKDGKAEVRQSLQRQGRRPDCMGMGHHHGQGEFASVDWFLSNECTAQNAVGGNGFRHSRRRPNAST